MNSFVCQSRLCLCLWPLSLFELAVNTKNQNISMGDFIEKMYILTQVHYSKSTVLFIQLGGL